MMCGYPTVATSLPTGKQSSRSISYLEFEMDESCQEEDVVVIVQLLSHVLLFATPWTAACQAFLPFTISWSWLRFMSMALVMPSNHLILCCPLLLLSPEHRLSNPRIKFLCILVTINFSFLS